MPPMTQPAETVGGLIRAARERAELSQVELAARSGLDPSTLAKYELDRREPTLPVLAKIALALAVSTRDLVPAGEVAARPRGPRR